MTARFFVSTENPKTTCASNSKVDKYCPTALSLVERLAQLAPDHRKAAMARAMRSVGVHGRDKPSMDMLRLAENPPKQLFAVLPDMGRWGVPINATEYEYGQRAVKLWGGTLDALADILDALEASVPDAWLAAISEDDLSAAAQAAAQLNQLTILDDSDAGSPEAQRARCAAHHRKALRRRAATARQQLAALLGTIGQGAASYADGFAVARWKERQAAARAFGMSRVAMFEDGRTATLWDLMETSRKSRLAALYAQTLGLDDLAQRRKLVPLFITMTLPPCFHPNPAHGQPYAGLEWTEAPSPADTDAALADMWQRFRARLAAANIDLLGLRVVEPHKDGCPHLHALLYVRSEDEAETVDRHLQAICPDPAGAPRVASKIVRINRSKASAASYVMKYLLKALPAQECAAELADGHERDGDPDHLAHHAEVCAWASERRLRRFAWLGLHGLRTAWQRIRNMTDKEAATAPAPVRAARHAMVDGRWADAMEALGVVRSDGAPRPRLTYEEGENKYGETVRRAVRLSLDDWSLLLRRGETRIVDKADLAAEQEAEAEETAMEARREEMRQWRAAWVRGERIPHPAFTVTVSYPRTCPVHGAEASPVLETGPPHHAAILSLTRNSLIEC